MIFKAIDKLIKYGLQNGLLEKEDIDYTRNRLLQVLRLNSYDNENADRIFGSKNKECLSEILD